MDTKLGRRSFLKGALASAPLVALGSSMLGTTALAKRLKLEGTTGPSTNTPPYLVPSIDGVETVAILTVGDQVGDYRMVGIPDGLGAFRTQGDDFVVLMNHEISATLGTPRRHGSKGAFVSRWTIDRHRLEVTSGQDFTQAPEDVHRWNPTSGAYETGTTAWDRFCSADLAAESAFFEGGLGTHERIFLAGEETSSNGGGRAWARIATGPNTGQVWQLPRLGRMAFENALACPHPQDKTIVFVTDDGNVNTAPVVGNLPSEIYIYIGTKTTTGNEIERAGLTNGSLFGVRMTVNGLPVHETDTFGLGTSSFVGSGRFELVDLGDVSPLTNAELEQKSIDNDVTRLQRPEDGAWDPRKKFANDFYFVTTATPTTNSRLWRLRFDDIENPQAGGSVEILLRGTEGHRMLDNVTIDGAGRILMDEDPGNLDRVAKIWLYAIATGEFVQVAEHLPKNFDPTIPNNPDFITRDEESSGIVDVAKILGKGWFLVNVQVHKTSPDAELVEGGQFLALYVDRSIGAGGEEDDGDA